MYMRLVGTAGLAIAAILCASPLQAQSENDLVLCAQIRDDAERLECFDRAARKQSAEIETAAPKESAPAAPPVAAPAPKPASVPPKTPASTSAPAPAATGGSAPAAAAEPEKQFGAEQTTRAKTEELKEIRSHIVGYFEGFSGGTEVRLANGQLWKQMDAARLPVLKSDPEVVIEKGFFGGYRLSVDGLNRSIRVKRIE